MAATTLMLGSCSGSADPSPGAITADENRQLNNAAAMLDANSIDLNQVAPSDETATGNESTPS